MATQSSNPRPELTILFDGDCPLCKREIRFLRRRDRERNRLGFEDIAEPGYDPSRYGLTLAEADAKIHAVKADGTVITGLEVFRIAYRAVGLGVLMSWTGWPGLRTIADAAYRWFARNRHRLTGRPCESGACTPAPRPGADRPR